MLVKKSVDVSVEVDVEVVVGLDDIVASIYEHPDGKAAVIRGVTQCCAFLKAIPDELIAKLSVQQRFIISEKLAEQSARFKNQT